MKKRLIVFVLTVCFAIAFCGCDVTEPSPDARVTTTTVAAPTTASTTGTTLVNEAPVLNTALFDAIGMTFARLSEQYGEVSLAFYEEGGPVYYFENSGPLFFSFNGFYEVEGGYDAIPLTEDGYWDLSAAPIPEDDDMCTGVYYAAASMVFTELAEPMEATDLAKLYRLGEPNLGQSLMTQQYNASFEVDGYDIRVLCEDDTYIVRPDVYVHITPVQ